MYSWLWGCPEEFCFFFCLNHLSPVLDFFLITHIRIPTAHVQNGTGFVFNFFLSFFVTGLQAEVKFPHLRGLVSCVSRAYLTVRETIYVFPILSPCLKRIWSYEHEPRAPAPGVSIALAPTHHSGCESPLFLIPENFLFLAWVWLSFLFFFFWWHFIQHLEWSGSGLR